MILDDPFRIFLIDTTRIRLMKIRVETAVDVDKEAQLRVILLEPRDQGAVFGPEEDVVIIRRQACDLPFCRRISIEDAGRGELPCPVAAG